jgi:GAF domain-containing protein
LADQLGLALEGARLYQETQRRALQEQLTRQITDKVRAAPDISTIAQTAAEELVKALGGVRGFVKLDTNKSDDNGYAGS